MQIIKEYDEFNHRRYGNPWVAIINPKTAKPDFAAKVGGYTGRYGAGEAGDLYVLDPKEEAVYMYGQKDYRGNNTERAYVQWRDGKFVPVDAKNLIETLQAVRHDG